MCIHSILTNLFEQNKFKIHKAHTNFLVVAVDAVLKGAGLTSAQLGRGLETNTTTKHNIKRVNNMLGNENLHGNRERISKSLVHSLIGNRKKPLIAVDWSSTSPGQKFYILRATLIIRKKGRGITIYEEALKW